MTKKEKYLSILLTFSMLLLIASCIFTLCENKPKGYSFAIENLYKNITTKLR